MNQAEPSRREQIVGFLGERAERRMPPSVADALAAAGGVLVAVGLIAIGFDQLGSNGSNVSGVILSLVVIAAAIAVPFWAPDVVRPACVAALVVGVPALWFFLIVAESSTGSTTGATVMTILTFAALFLVPRTRGRIVLLAVTLLWLSGWIVEEVSGTEATSFTETPTFDTGSDDEFSNFDDDSGDVNATSIVSLILGGGMLAGGWALDRQRLSGLATPFLVVGAITALSGAAIFSADNELATTGLIVILTGAGIAAAAAPGPGRRATTWIGAVAVVFGLVLVLFDVADDSVVTFGILAAVLGAGVTALTLVLPPWLRPHEPATDGGPAGPLQPGPAPPT